MFLLDLVKCGGYDVPSEIIKIIHTIITLIKIVVPILLVIYGMLDLGKAVMAQKEDEIKKGQQTFIKRLVAAAIVFLVVFVVQLVVGLVSDESKEVTSCLNCIVNNNCPATRGQ